jgi:hypothetical protein
MNSQERPDFRVIEAFKYRHAVYFSLGRLHRWSPRSLGVADHHTRYIPARAGQKHKRPLGCPDGLPVCALHQDEWCSPPTQLHFSPE